MQVKRINCCVYCGDNNKAWKCNKITDVSKRQELLRKENRCFNCLKKSHTSKQCTSKYTCYHCRNKHNSSLCERDKWENLDVHNTNVSYYGESIENVVFLKTALATISSTNESKGNKARILLDDCSQRSYIKKDLRDKLKLNVLTTRGVIIKGVCRR